MPLWRGWRVFHYLILRQRNSMKTFLNVATLKFRRHLPQIIAEDVNVSTERRRTILLDRGFGACYIITFWPLLFLTRRRLKETKRSYWITLPHTSHSRLISSSAGGKTFSIRLQSLLYCLPRRVGTTWRDGRRVCGQASSEQDTTDF